MAFRSVVVVAFSLLCALLSLSGCAVPTSYLENDAGQRVKCQWVGIGVIGVPLSMLGDAVCVAKYQKQGYHVIDAPGAVPGTGGTVPATSAPGPGTQPTGATSDSKGGN
jgi:hypothetical protein